MRTLLDDLEHEARQRAVGLEATGKLPQGFVEQHYPLTPSEAAELKRLKHAMAATTDPDTYVALAKGRDVDPSRLDPKMVAYWRRHG